VTLPASPPEARISRRHFLAASACAVGGLAVYAGEFERHATQITHRDAFLPGLPAAFDGFRVAQLSDIHLDEFTEPFFLRDAVAQVNRLAPDAVFLTGDYVTREIGTRKYAIGAAWQCADILKTLQCRQVYAILGNHDVVVSGQEVTRAFTSNGIPMLINSNLPLERDGARIWLAGLDDPVCGRPNLNGAIPPSIRHIPHEPIILLCHAPDYANRIIAHPAGQAVALMLSGHTHGGQVRAPFLPPLYLPPLGKMYIEGWFYLGGMQLYVNRGLGSVGVPFRLDCPPEITLFTFHAQAGSA
jgi:uncharacterized protein